MNKQTHRYGIYFIVTCNDATLPFIIYVLKSLTDKANT